jgi:hypothetical protein
MLLQQPFAHPNYLTDLMRQTNPAAARDDKVAKRKIPE